MPPNGPQHCYEPQMPPYATYTLLAFQYLHSQPAPQYTPDTPLTAPNITNTP